MLDALSLPALGTAIVVFLVAAWVKWLAKPDGQALKETALEDEEDSDR